MSRLPNLRSIEVKYYGATNYRGSRVKITDLRGIIKKPLWIDWDDEYSSAANIAQDYLESQGWSFKHQTEAPKAHLLLTDDFRSDFWHMKNRAESLNTLTTEEN